MKSNTKISKTKDNQQSESDPGMSIIVKTITRLTVGLLFLYGINIALHGHLYPGGGFAGGAIIALSLLNLVLAFGQDAALEKLSHSRAIMFSTFGLIVFMFVGLFPDILDIVFNGSGFLREMILGFFNIGSIPFLNIALFLQVGAGIFAIFICLVSINKEES